MMRLPSAIILTNGILDSVYAKTCHGLLRGTERFNIVAVIDHKFAGQRTGDLISDAKDVPIVSSVQEYLEQNSKPEWCIVGVAFEGGLMPGNFRDSLFIAVGNGISVANGLHTLLTEDEDFMDVALANGAEVVDIRKPKSLGELKFWSGNILKVDTPRIAVLGMDCAVGKRTTTKFLKQELRDRNVKAEMIYTGQTGWLEGNRHGVILDSTLNDFVSGELEDAVLRCVKEASPDIMIIEGQSALRNPTGPCGSELIISLRCRYVILQHDPSLQYFDNNSEWAIELPSLSSEIELIRLLGAEVLAVVVIPGPDNTALEGLGVPVFTGDKEGFVALAQLVSNRILTS